jgi:bzd-type benzoyl-CoA reductase N subunit
MKELEIFREITENPYDYAQKTAEETGKKVAGYFCTYTPEEILHAADLLPFRIFGTSENITLADSHLQSYCCSLVRGGLEEALSGKLSFLSGTVFPHTCDSIQRLSDIWRINANFPVHLDIILPVKLNTESSQKYAVDVFKKFRRDVEESFSIKISDGKLAESIRLYNSIRKLLTEIYTLKSGNPGIIAGQDVYRVIKAGMIMEKTQYLQKLKELHAALEKKKDENGGSYKRILLAGGICNHPDIYSLLEDFGGAVIWDDLCTGSRFFTGTIDETKDPIEGIATRYIERNVCPAKHVSITSRGDNLVKLVKEKNASGVIFIYLKFCDPQAFDYPYLKETMEREGVPTLLLEIDEQSQSYGQLKTRFETFVEMLEK